MGMNQAHSNHACLFCSVHKDKRWDITHHYEKRTLATMEHCRQSRPSSKERLGCVAPPLLEVEIDRIAIDTLHLMLRITDVLLRNLVHAMIHRDLVAGRGTTSLDKLVSAIRSCGISFKVWKERQEKRSDSYNWTSLRGRDRRTLLKRLPPLVPDLFADPSVGQVVESLWNDFDHLLSLFGTESPSEEILKETEVKAIDWVTKFLSLPTLEGHKKANVTPYIHIMAAHVPHQMRRFGGVLRFSGQGVEKNNDDARRNFLSSNRWDAPKEVLLAEHRLDCLAHYARKKRQYHKKRPIEEEDSNSE